ncbi:hypothetical protein NIN28_000605 [Salmonella enterica]|nr:hypothetical protein [Salmonella enterica subsp. enterica serovar Sandiego]EFR3365590.1 hypothetical protein [Salmonella enterica]EHP1716777.1 hypothetical protein [Salmonella enterica subsp. enterica serovar Javiana]EFR3574195.1 hypothetical protein [Salmonella enterica]EFR3664492.1 hypothetical protein [Salmonella enterica]
MQQVKIYTAPPSDLSPPVQSESFCVDLVLASDYRELEQKCAALAAENAHMQQVIGDVQTLYYESDGIVGYHLNGDIAKWDDVMPDLWSEAPATDAFLAEVRASGVDAAIEHLHKKFGGTGHIGVPVMALEWLAQEIRKGSAA